MTHEQDCRNALREYNKKFKNYLPQQRTNNYCYSSTASYNNTPQTTMASRSTSNYTMLGYVMTNPSGTNKSGIE